MSYYDPDLAAPRAPTPAPVSRAKLYALVGTALCCMGAWLVTQGGPAGVATQRFRAVVPGVSPQTASYAASVTGLPVDDAGLAASSPTSGHRRGGGLLGVFGGLFGGGGERKYPIEGDEGLMSQKAHGTTEKAVQEDLRWGCDRQVADKICSYNRHFAEFSGYWQTTAFAEDAATTDELTFYDSVSGRPLFRAPRGRTMAEFLAESRSHGWPSFRDAEVVWENVRVIRGFADRLTGGGEAVSMDGTHLGHNLPDFKGNRCDAVPPCPPARATPRATLPQGGEGGAARHVVDGLRTEVCGQRKQSKDPGNAQHNPRYANY